MAKNFVPRIRFMVPSPYFKVLPAMHIVTSSRTHISTSGACETFGNVKTGEKFTGCFSLRYNKNAHILVMEDDACPYSIMGISRVHIVPL
jgi:hypothetical protein